VSELSSAQKLVLERFFATPLGERFYLTGGTALAGFHLHHRVSLDLDLFTPDAEAPNEAARWVLIQRDQGALLVTSHFAQGKGFHNFRLVVEGERLRVDLCHDPAPQRPKALVGTVRVDGLLDILANKVVALIDFPDPKHAVDLFFGVTRGGLAFSSVLAHAEAKRSVERFRLARALHDAANAPTAGLRLLLPFDPAAYRSFLTSLRDDLLRGLSLPSS
jgi:hypothetical protein